MNSKFFASQSGIAFAVAGVIAGIVTATYPASASQGKLPTQADSSELAVQPSDRPLMKDDQKADDDIKSLPEAVSNSIFKEVSDKNGVQASQLRIVEVKRETWSDGCLGLGGVDAVCTQSMVPGWRVVVANSARRWVYRANQAGSLVKLDEVATRSLTSETSTQVTRREEVTSTRTTQTSQSVTGGSSQSAQAVTGMSGSQSSTTQSTQAVTGVSGSQRTQAATGVSASQSRTSQSSQAASSTQMAQGTSTSTQRQVTAARSRTQINFKDVSQSYWARDFIAELAGRGILTGYPDGQFHPNDSITRAQFAALVATVFNKTKVRNTISFRDVSSSYWAYEKVRDAYEMGFLEVDSRNSFNPDQSMTRLQILTALAKGLNYSVTTSTEKVLQYYSDASAIPASARNLVAAATERGIVVNYPNVKTCNPNQVATRAEVAAIIYQGMVNQGSATAISSPYVAAVTQTGASQAGQAAPVAPVAPAAPVAPTAPAAPAGESSRNKPARQNCNQGIGNGAEGCDPGNSSPRGGSNDEGGRTPGNRPK
jgi:hypothetical protein